MDSLLAPYRVLDLTDAKGFLCGKILGDLGADVIKIERPVETLSEAHGSPPPHPEIASVGRQSRLWRPQATSQ